MEGVARPNNGELRSEMNTSRAMSHRRMRWRLAEGGVHERRHLAKPDVAPKEPTSPSTKWTRRKGPERSEDRSVAPWALTTGFGARGPANPPGFRREGRLGVAPEGACPLRKTRRSRSRGSEGAQSTYRAKLGGVRGEAPHTSVASEEERSDDERA